MSKNTRMKRNSLFKVSLLLFMHITVASNAQLKTLSGKPISGTDLDLFIHKKMDSLGLPGLSFALINDGKIVYYRSLGLASLESKQKVDANSIFEAASMSKTVFAYFVLRMVDKGLLTLDTPLYKYLPNKDIEKDPRYKSITARMVLSHTTGFPNWRYFDQRDTSIYQYGELYLKFSPGTQFAYSGEGYHYLAQVIAQLNHRTIQTLDPLFQSEVARPMGMKKAWFSGNKFISDHKVNGYNHSQLVKAWPASLPDQDSTWFGAAGGLHTESTSFASFLIGLMNGKGLSKTSYAELFKEQVKLPRDSPHHAVNGDTGWGLGIAIKPVRYGTIYEHGGNNGNFQSGFKINKANQNGYVFLTNCDKGVLFNQAIGAILIQ